LRTRTGIEINGWISGSTRQETASGRCQGVRLQELGLAPGSMEGWTQRRTVDEKESNKTEGVGRSGDENVDVDGDNPI